MTMLKVNQRLLGEGALTWSRAERVGDRYGAVYLIEDNQNSLTAGPARSLIDAGNASVYVGQRGDLLASVTKTRKSTHIGDMFHGIAPRTPEIGQLIKLGTGRFFTEPAPDSGVQVGVAPDDNRETLWLDLRALYDAHEQTVMLIFHPEGA